jgi:hypothetical protein
MTVDAADLLDKLDIAATASDIRQAADDTQR